MPATPETWIAEFTANAATAGTQFQPRIAQLTSGNILIAWTSSNNAGVGSPAGTDIIGQLFDPFGAALGSEVRLNGFTADDERDFDIAALNNGRFVVVYEDDSGVAASQVIRATEWSSGTGGLGSITANRVIATSPALGDVVDTPTVTAAANGSYTVGYAHADVSIPDRDLRFVTVSATGAIGPERIAISGSDRASSGVEAATLSNGNVVFVHDHGSADDAIAFSVRNPVTGASPTGATFVANTDANGDVDRDPSVVALSGGGFVIAWSNIDSVDTDIEFQRFTNAGATLGGVVTVAGGGASDDNNEVRLVALADGGFLVLWDNDAAGSAAGNGQRYSAAGAPVGSVFRFDAATGFEVDAALLDDGRVAITWNDGEIRSTIVDTRDTANPVPGPSGVQTGTAGNDVFTASGSARIVHGGDGNDTITEAGTVKAYHGGAGNDRINVVSPINADRHDGGAGRDTIDWSAASVSGATFSLAAGTATLGAASEAMVNFENLNGTSNADTIIGSGGDNVLNGNNGNDRIEGGAGNDTLDGGFGNDTLLGGLGTDTVIGGAGNDRILILDGEFIDAVNGGAGNDTLDMSDVAGASEAVTAVAGGAFTGLGGTRSITSIEEFAGTRGNDVITGFDVARGGLGNDTIRGGFGSQRLFGDAGNDLFTIGDGQFVDSVDGGAGLDMLDLSSLSAADFNGATVDFDAGLLVDDFAAGGSVTLASLETYVDNAGDNEILDSSGGMTINAGGGNDILRENASGGSDRFDLGSGNDLLEINNSGIGGDSFAGGVGNDTISFANIAYATGSGVRIDLAAGTLTRGGGASESIAGFENAIGSAGTERITGTSGANRLNGQGGDDTIEGLGGDDTLRGDTGDDVLLGGSGGDFAVGGAGGDTVNGGSGNDTLVGNSGNDVMNGGGDDDLLRGDAGDDTLDGADGDDNMRGGFNDDLLRGGSGDDTLAGETGSDALLGDAGNDAMNGGLGNDTLRGGTGNDLVEGRGNDDLLFGEAGADTLNGDFGNDNMNGGAGDDVMNGGAGVDRMAGSSGNDTMDGGNQDDRVFGNAGNDALSGGNGSDLLVGATGLDRLDGGAGIDTLVGGTDNDTLTGGLSRDLFVFADTHDLDLITDFTDNQDILRLNDNLWGGGLSEAQVVSLFATSAGGNTVFDFGGGDVLTLNGIANPNQLIDDISIF